MKGKVVKNLVTGNKYVVLDYTPKDKIATLRYLDTQKKAEAHIVFKTSLAGLTNYVFEDN